MVSKKKSSEFVPTMTQTEIQARMAEAKVKLTEAQAISEAVKARKAQLELDVRCDNLVYIDTALDEFNSKLKLIVSMIKHIPDELGNGLNLEPEGYKFIQSYIQKVLFELSQIEFEFETSRQIDEKAATTHTSNKASRIKEKRA